MNHHNPRGGLGTALERRGEGRCPVRSRPTPNKWLRSGSHLRPESLRRGFPRVRSRESPRVDLVAEVPVYRDPTSGREPDFRGPWTPGGYKGRPFTPTVTTGRRVGSVRLWTTVRPWSVCPCVWGLTCHPTLPFPLPVHCRLRPRLGLSTSCVTGREERGSGFV